MIRNRRVAMCASALATALIASLAPAGVGAVTASAAILTTRQVEASFERGAMAETNRFRRIHHRPKLRHHACLNRKAEEWARHLEGRALQHLEGRALQHQSLAAVLRQCQGRMASENLALQSRTGATARSAVRLLMTSPGHRRNILDRDATHVGVATVYDNGRRAYITVQVFGRFPALDRRQDAADQLRRLSRRLERGVTAHINAERRARNRRALGHNRVLNSKAEEWAHQVATHRVGLRHQSMTAVRRAARARAVGENIVRIGGRFVSPARVVDTMMHQRANRRRLLNRGFTDIGVAASWDRRRQQWVVVEVFANRPRRG